MKKSVLLFGIIVMLSPAAVKSQVPAGGMKLWLRSDAGVYRDLYITAAGPNDKIRVWADQSGYGNDFFQPDTDKQPFLINNVLCGKPVTRFEQSRRTFMHSLMRMSGQKTVFIVFNLRPFTNAAQTLLSLKGNSDEFSEIVTTDFSGYRPVTFISDLPSTTNGSMWRNSTGINVTFSSQGNLVAMMYNGGDLSTPASYNAYYDNTAASVLNNGLLGRYVYDSTTIGARAPFHNINFLNGDIAEIIVYDRILTATEMAETSDYLLYKFGLDNNCTLSVRMHYFRASAKNKSVELSWKTEEEENTRRFEVQHSTDGSLWKTIETVAAIHSSNNLEKEYTSLHKKPQTGWNFYRIVAFNEVTDVFTSEIRKIYFDPAAVQEIRLYPNPADDKLFIDYSYPVLLPASVADASGKLIRKITVLLPGELCIKDLPSGVYFLQIHGNNFNTTLKFYKK